MKLFYGAGISLVVIYASVRAEPLQFAEGGSHHGIFNISSESGSFQSGSFQNLDFEAGAFVPLLQNFRINFDAAFPSWRGYVGGAPQTVALSNTFALSSSTITLYDSHSLAIEGNLSAGFHATARFDHQPADVAIAQIGWVPNDAQSLLFRAQTFGDGFGVELGGQSLSLAPLLTTPDYVLFGADISGWAAEQAELRFTAFAGNVPGLSGTHLVLDSIQFSIFPVPEPSTLALFAVGGMFGWFCWRCKRR